jgi:putative ABC transport system permease protein
VVKDPVLFKNRTAQLPGVLSSTISSFLPTDTREWPNFISNGNEGIAIQFWPVDKDYINTLDIKILKGRNFSSRFSTDSSAVLINESASKMLGFGDDPLNKSLYFQNKKVYHVVGMVKDFNFKSLKEPVSPLVMPLTTQFELNMEGDTGDKLSLRVNPTALPHLLKELKHQWSILSTGQPFEYSFMEEDFNALYKTEQQTETISMLFTTLAIIIACLGLFALSSYSAEKRSREISIRKVLGANAQVIASMLSKDFLKLILIANMVGIPVAWILMHFWLNDFADRVKISGWMCLKVALTVLLIASATIIFQTVKAARTNPVQGLKSYQ